MIRRRVQPGSLIWDPEKRPPQPVSPVPVRGALGGGACVSLLNYPGPFSLAAAAAIGGKAGPWLTFLAVRVFARVCLCAEGKLGRDRVPSPLCSHPRAWRTARLFFSIIIIPGIVDPINGPGGHQRRESSSV